MTIATSTYYSLPQILKQILEIHLHLLLDKPARYQRKWTYNNGMVIYEVIQYQENILPSHKTPLDPSRYGPNKGWITLGIEQTNLGKKNTWNQLFPNASIWKCLRDRIVERLAWIYIIYNYNEISLLNIWNKKCKFNLFHIILHKLKIHWKVEKKNSVTQKFEREAKVPLNICSLD